MRASQLSQRRYACLTSLLTIQNGKATRFISILQYTGPVYKQAVFFLCLAHPMESSTRQLFLFPHYLAMFTMQREHLIPANHY